MKNNSTSRLVRIFVIFAIIFIVTEANFKTGPDPAFVSNPSVTLFLIFAFIGLIAVDGIIQATQNIHLTKDEFEAQQAAMNVEGESGFKGWLKKMWKSKPLEEEEDILLDHDYDGIKELDNALPPWWLYGFYVSIVFAFLYLGYYHILGGDNQITKYENEMAKAKIEVELYKRQNPNTLDANSVTVSSDTEAGKKIFKQNCAICHMADGGGSIGPNLTDEYWILGGGIKNIFNTISEGGRDGKGMIAWKNSLSPEKIQQVASYVLSLQGTTPKKPKAKEGELWTEE
ncbi:c-type cytochrome [Flavobacteriaceae bacterium F08102]|nr:c-type cytochrome [Flavobacteriaceae bacterium F08102]